MGFNQSGETSPCNAANQTLVFTFKQPSINFYYDTRRRVIVLTDILMTIFDIMHNISPRMNQVVALPNFPNN
ncbi:hypothetical protein C1S45_03210 [Lactiplantibacillus plantarum]|nr:hypothetical protein C1940_13845 [Lactiplantibacillus plantarum subsp. plantarum]AVE83511.1 hypothetical protein C4O30_11110 [Lactiplantibacillus plantarum]TYA18636.1 hypothetical protein FXE14_09025 [Lactobacillus sp. LSI2-1]AVW05950.1 hypothetical protein DA078_14385 [Lactiplantibacillus plantarum]AXQ26457.1 hypothetical protein D0Y51_12260 [Lactiplantibacillus plantarum]